MDRRKWIRSNSMAGAGLILAPHVSFLKTQSMKAHLIVQPKWHEEGFPLKHSWAGIGNIDQARWIMRSDMQQQLQMCADEIGLKHLRFGNIFEEQLWVYDLDPSKYHTPGQRHTKRINWRNPFFIYDCLLALKINPIVGTYFMPWFLASGTDTCYEIKTNITPPRDLKEWGNFIHDFISSIVDRYGIDTVRNWYFEIWNEPNLKSYYPRMDEYWPLYRTAYNVIKSVDPALKVGGPSTAHSAYLDEMLGFGRKNNCLPDFLTGHIYNNDSNSGDPLSPYEGPQIDRENKSPNYITGIARGVRKLLQEASYSGEYHMNEWGLSWYPYRAERETPNEAAYIVKTMKEISQMCDYFAYWCLSDIYVECGFGREAFHGNYGMISLDGLKKPGFFAHQLLCKLGNTQIKIENDADHQLGSFVTKDQEVIKTIIYSFDIDFQIGNSPVKKQIEFHLPDNIGSKFAQIIRIDSKENNILTVWNEIGQPAHPKKDELSFLMSKNQLTKSGNIPVIKDSAGNRLIFEMESPGLVYFEIE
jgi:xylan 1,4-beta-xylosidase